MSERRKTARAELLADRGGLGMIVVGERLACFVGRGPLEVVDALEVWVALQALRAHRAGTLRAFAAVLARLGIEAWGGSWRVGEVRWATVVEAPAWESAIDVEIRALRDYAPEAVKGEVAPAPILPPPGVPELAAHANGGHA